jgi:hypothetical protein
MDKTKLAALLREAAYTIDLNDEYETNIGLVKELYAAAQELVPVYEDNALAMVTYSGTVHLAVYSNELWYMKGTTVRSANLDSIVVVGTATLNAAVAEQMRNTTGQPVTPNGPWPLTPLQDSNI